MRFLPLVLLLLAPIVSAQGTGTLAGTVIDEYGEPLPGANVIVEGAQLGAATDIDGNYRIIGAPIGMHVLTASYVGFESLTMGGVLVRSGSTTETDFQLVMGEYDEWIGGCGGERARYHERPLTFMDFLDLDDLRIVPDEEIRPLPVEQ